MKALYGKATVAQLEAISSWLGGSLRCLIGKSEFRKGRFGYAVIEAPEDFHTAINVFKIKLKELELTSCLMIIEPNNINLSSLSGLEIVDYFKRYCVEADDSHTQDGTVKSFNCQLCVQTICPVTEVILDFPDFDFVAFYPQSIDESDKLYDPSMYAPVPCINVTSDLYGFAMITREISIDRLGIPPSKVSNLQELDAIFKLALNQYQKMAEKTIEGYGKATNPERICPIHLTKDQKHYISPRDESALIEVEKQPHLSEMPVMYGARIVEKWMKYFASLPNYSDISVKSIIYSELMEQGR